MYPIRLAISACFVLILSTPPAFAYIDPGTGSLIIQGLIGALAAGAFYSRALISKIRSFFGGDKNDDEELLEVPDVEKVEKAKTAD